MTSTLRVLVADMQPITPAIGGGRLRLLGVYHKLKPNIDCIYVGSYNWPGEPPRDQRLSETLREIVVPLSNAHFDVDARLREVLPGETIIDSLFGILSPLSTNYCETLWAELERADVVVLAHPWVYPLVADRLNGKPLIYDSQNVEGLLKSEISKLYRNGPISREVVKQVVAIEASLVDAADCIFCCSADDKDLFGRLYEAPAEKMILIPNGVFVEALVPPALSRASKERLQAVFIGSNYQPNVDAAQFIIAELATDHPDLKFVLAGGVGDNATVQNAARDRPNVVVTGFLSDAERLEVLHQADFAVNPMATGSGTNIKMFDFMAVGLPVVVTPIGARGIATPGSEGLITAEIDNFSSAVATLKSQSPVERNRLGSLNRDIVCREFAWETISVRAAEAIERVHANGRTLPLAGRKSEAAAPRVFARPGKRKVGIVSTYDIKCGIAGYTEDFVDGLQKNGCRSHIFAPHPFLAQRLHDSLPNVSTAWFYDDIFHAHSKIEIDYIVRKSQALQIDHINIQYHSGFFSFDNLIRLIDGLRAGSLTCSVTLHYSVGLSQEQLSSLGKHGALLLVHDSTEIRRAQQVANARLLPHGIQDSVRASAVKPLSVGTFGFLRPHKGIYELISAFDLIRAAEPRARLIACCAEYPGGESRAERIRCEQLIVACGLQEYVDLETSFLSREEILERLAACEVNVLAYHPSAEGASGAASYCVAARRPLITSRSKIFEPLSDAVYHLEMVDPNAIALAILGVIHNPALRADLENRVARFANERSWSLVAAQFLEAITEEPRLVAQA